MSTADLPRTYETYCKPKVAELLRAVRLDKVYHRAEGDYAYYADEAGAERKVIDFLGGYGSVLFGHNNPELVAVAKDSFDKKLPFSSQASCRGTAALLCEKLSMMMHRRTRRNFVTTLASTGAEAVEAAIKHAEFVHQRKIEEIHSHFTRERLILRRKYREGELSIAPGMLQMIQERFGVPPHASFSRHMLAVRNHNYRIFRKPPTFLALNKSFHGKTSGAVQLTHYTDYRTPFERIGIDVIFLEPGDKQALNRAVADSLIPYFWPCINDKGQITLEEKLHVNISAFFIEPIQGEGGIRIIPKEYLEYYRAICTEHRIPLVFDEIQCGMGRTGTFLFSEQQGVVADYYLLSKSLGGGLAKISAMMVHDEQYEREFGFIHSSTFAEDDHSAAISLAALNMLDRDETIFTACQERGEMLIKGLREIQTRFPGVIEEVRGCGLMIGLQFANLDRAPSSAFKMLSVQKLLGYVIAGYLLHEHGIRVAPTLSSSATIRLEPSAFISEADCALLLTAIRRLCEVIYKRNIYELTRFIVNAESPGSTEEVGDYRTASTPVELPRTMRKVAFIGHFIEARHMPLFDKSYERFTAEECERFLEKVYELVDPQIYEEIPVRSITGEMVSLNFIGFIVDSKIISRYLLSGDVGPLHDKIETAVNIAVENGCQVMGFGGFTSIITRNCTSIINDSIGLTSGNSFTVAIGLEALRKAAVQAGIDPTNGCLAALGATGNICSIYSEIMAEEVPRIILIGRPGSGARLSMVAADIYLSAFNQILAYESDVTAGAGDAKKKRALTGIAREIYDTKSVRHLVGNYLGVERIGEWLLDHLSVEMMDALPVVCTEDMSMVKHANMIVCASNTPAPVIYPNMLGEGPIVISDIAVPNDVDDSVLTERSDVMVIQGGVVRLPYNPDFMVGGIPLDPGTSFACMAETILLGLTGIREHYSYGRITKVQVKKIQEIAKIHGFSLGRFKTERSF